MRILLTGATGYIAQRLLPDLSENGHDVICYHERMSRLFYRVQVMH
jgi:nucleoside-diphosphate-sugar epimerase